ncbi:restriction endonuclease subunit S [Priestia aryabhattai]
MSKKKAHTLNELLEEVLVLGNEQPYDIPKNWVYVRLGKVVEFQGGSQPPKSVFKDEQLDGYVRLIQIRDFKSDKFKTYIPKELAKRTFKENDVMIGRYGPPVFQILRGLSGAYNVALMKAKPVERLMDNDYLYYLLQAPFIQNPVIKESHRTAGQTGVRKELIEDFVIGLPPLKEQIQIAEKVESLFNKIEEAKQLIEEAREIFELRRAAILDKAFRGKLTAKWRKENSKTKSISEYLMELKSTTNLKQDSEIVPPYELPNGWHWARIGDLFHVQIGSTPSRKNEEYWNGDYPWLSSGEVQFNNINAAREGVTELAVKEKRLKLVPKGAVLFGMIGEGKTRGQVALLNIDAFHNQNVASIWVSETKIHSSYVYYWLMSRYMENRQKSAGNNQPAYNKSRVQELLIPIAPLEEIELIVKRLEKLLKLEEEVRDLLSLEKLIEQKKQSILSKAFRGELGTNDPSEESAIELLKEVLEEQVK